MALTFEQDDTRGDYVVCCESYTCKAPRLYHGESFHTPEEAQGWLDAEVEKNNPFQYRLWVTTWEEFENAERAFWLTNPCRQITKEAFYHYFDVMAPVQYGTHKGIESFFMAKRASGNFTMQHAIVRGTNCENNYYGKMVDLMDAGTWITPKDIQVASPVIDLHATGDNPGFCRVYYRDKSDNDKRLFCMQEEAKGLFTLHECTKDGEPSHPIDIAHYRLHPVDTVETEGIVGAVNTFLREKLWK